MVIDTSAIVAILFDEPGAESVALAIASAPRRLLSAAGRVELTLVVEGRKGEEGRRKIAEFFAEIAIEIAPVTIEQAKIACEAFRRYGKGRHPAALNFGDCFAYALGRATGEPLLCTGADFARTDAATVAWNPRPNPRRPA